MFSKKGGINMKLEELGLGVDVATRLRKNGCNSVEDLCELTIEKLEEITNREE